MNNHPPLSVLVPLYNAGPFIADALTSIRRQTVEAKEIIVINDGSTDGGPDIVKTFSSVTLLHQENKGCASALNKGLEIATGDYLAFLDADDLWLPKKTELQLQALEANPDLDMVFCQCRRFRSEKIEGVWENTPLDVVVGLSKTGMLIKKTSFEKAGRFPPTDKAHDFLDWFARAKEVGLRYEIHPEILTERRIHDRNHGVLRRNDQQQTYFKTLKNMLDRRREKNQEP